MSNPSSSPSPAQQLISKLEHTKLHFEHGANEDALIRQLCEEAQQYGMATVCVRPQHVMVAREALGHRSDVILAAVVGFPEHPVTREVHEECPVIGACNSTTKLQEITTIQGSGGEEFDVVMNVAFLKTDYEIGGSFTLKELQGLRMAAGDMPIKLILEVDLLSDDEIRFALSQAVEADIDTIKTSTGYLKGGQGATPERIAFIRHYLDELGAFHIGIKASGGVRSLDDALAVQAVGATRIGSSACVAIAQAALEMPVASAFSDFY
jgi:deoxyribose-phosphate aldolase